MFDRDLNTPMFHAVLPFGSLVKFGKFFGKFGTRRQIWNSGKFSSDYPLKNNVCSKQLYFSTLRVPRKEREVKTRLL